MKPELNRSANERFLVGDHITNKELLGLYSYYDHLGSIVTFLDPKMSLFVTEIFNRHQRLQQYGINRSIIDHMGIPIG